MQTIDGTINLFDLVGELWRRKIVIASIALAVGVVVTGITFLMPNTYKADTLLAPATFGGSSNSLSLGGGTIGSLASLANIGIPQTNSTDEHISILRSRQFIYSFVEKNDLLPILFAEDWDSSNKEWLSPAIDERPTLLDAYRKIVHEGVLSVAKNRDNQLVEVSVIWTDPAQAAEWANGLISLLNDFVRKRAIERSEDNLAYLENEIERTNLAELRQTIFQLIGEEQKSAMFANTQKEFAFRILDSAVVPDRRNSPRRSLTLVSSTFAGGALAILIVLIQFVYRRQKIIVEGG